jgi:hypothetical protein
VLVSGIVFQYVALRKEESQADGQQTGVWIWVLDIGGETRGDARIAQQRIPGDISCSGSARRMDMEADEARFRTMQASSIREQAMRDLNTFRTLIDLINEARAWYLLPRR